MTSGSRVLRRVITVAIVVTVSACQDQAPHPQIAIALTPDTLSQRVGDSSVTTVMITRNGFRGDVTLALEAPTGITYSLDPAVLKDTATRSLLTVRAGGETSMASTLRVSASAAGVAPVSATATIFAEAYSIFPFVASLIEPLVIIPGSSGALRVFVYKYGVFYGDIDLSVTGLPPGVTATTATAGASLTPTGWVTLTISAAAGTAAGTHRISVEARTAHSLQSQAVDLEIRPAPARTEVAFRLCPPVAAGWSRGSYQYRNEGEPWKPLVADSLGYFRFSATPRVGFSYSWGAAGSGGSRTFYVTAAELQAMDCPYHSGGSRQVYGTVADTMGTRITIGAGAFQPTRSGATMAFTTSVRNGPLDLIAFNAQGYSGRPAIILRGGIDPADQDTLPVLDFSSAEAISLDSIPLISGMGNVYAGVSTSASTLMIQQTSLGQGLFARPLYVPAARLAASAYDHWMYTTPGGTGVEQYFRANPPASMPADLQDPGVTLTTLARPRNDRVVARVDVTASQDVSMLGAILGLACTTSSSSQEVFVSRAYAGAALAQRSFVHVDVGCDMVYGGTMSYGASGAVLDGSPSVFWGGVPGQELTIRHRGLSGRFALPWW